MPDHLPAWAAMIAVLAEATGDEVTVGFSPHGSRHWFAACGATEIESAGPESAVADLAVVLHREARQELGRLTNEHQDAVDRTERLAAVVIEDDDR